MTTYTIHHGAPSGNLIHGPYAVHVLAIEPNGAVRTASMVTGIQTAERCDLLAAEYAHNFGASIQSPMLAPLVARLTGAAR